MSAQLSEYHQALSLGTTLAQPTQAANTYRLRKSVLLSFQRWCQDHAIDWVVSPLTTETIMAYAGHLVLRKVARATLDSHMTVLSWWHGYNHLKNPFETDEVTTLWRNAQAKLRPKEGKAPVTGDMLQKGLAVGTFTDEERHVLLTGFLTGLRVSELCSLQRDDLHRHGEGMLIHIRQSKTDQSAQGQWVGIPHHEQTHTLLETLWARPLHAPLFPSYQDHRKVRRLVKRMVVAAGENPKDFSAHSLRRGVATTAYRANVDVEAIRVALRHEKRETTQAYITHEGLLDSPVLHAALQALSPTLRGLTVINRPG